MSAEPRADIELDALEDTPPPANGNGGSLIDYWRGYVSRVKGGQIGSLPALGGLLVITAFFSVAHSGFFTAYNIEALVVQAAPTIIMAMGLIFVLLLGEIDLSAGTSGGLCAAIMAVLLVRQSWPWYLAVLVALIFGVLIGFFTGFLRAKVGIPSFVTTLATFLAFQGVTLILIGGRGSIGVPSRPIIALEGLNRDFMPIWLGWTLAAVLTLGYAAVKVRTAASRRRANLPAEPLAVIAVKVVALAVIAGVFTYLMGINRILVQNSAFFNIKSVGMPYSVLLITILFVVWNYVLSRTRYGRHVYAVGGNDEAARRAGIPVSRIRISVFVICSGMAALSGLTFASELESVQSNAGAGNVLLLAVGAAVIGGTSLFGGRGRIIDAILGGLVVAVIQNGMSDFIQGANSSGWQYIVTGIVLLIAAGVDAVARRGSRTT